MSRARATALALVNWKGVFYERYLLDPHVTALEGANGAGKTTVMIAAYVVLLPDLGRLRFTNLGESGAKSGDRGIWGRLGEEGRPSYVAMEVALASGERVILGVLLERKAEPALDLTPFLIRGVQAEGRLKSLFVLVREELEEIPVFAEVRANVAELGGELQVFASAKEYFAALFELGVTPFRLGSDEERNKWNEMLRTSMTGGISRALTTDLRSFLLKEETGLSDTLSRMRGNLDTCHRTRVEVAEARKLEHEISGVHEAGRQMMAAALLGMERSARELEARASSLRNDEEIAHAEVSRLGKERDESEARLRQAEEREQEARGQREEATRAIERFDRASRLAEVVAKLETELSAARETTEVVRGTMEAAAQTRAERRMARDRAREAYERASRGLGDLQKGLEELHVQVHAKRRADRTLDLLREELARPTLLPGDLAQLAEELRASCETLDRERSKLDRDRELARVRAGEWEKANAALKQIAGEAVREDPFERAQTELAREAELERTAMRFDELTTDCRRTEELARRQAKLRSRVEALGVIGVSEHEDPLGAALREEEETRARLDAELAEASTRLDTARRRAASFREELERLHARSRRFALALPVLKRVELGLGLTIDSRASVLDAQNRLAIAREECRRRVAELEATRESLLEQARALEHAGGVFHPDLLRLREELDAELFANRFEEIDLEEAARVEASLGPLSHALVVDDLERAQAKIAGRERELDSVWLIPAGELGALPSLRARVQGGDLLVDEALGVRITRLPTTPSLGKGARERRAAELRTEAEAVARTLDEVVLERRRLETLTNDLETIANDVAVLEAGDPREAIEEAERALTATNLEVEGEAARVDEIRGALAARAQRIEGLRSCLREAYLLEPPDYGALLEAQKSAYALAREARLELERTREARRTLRAHADALRTPPLSVEEERRLEADRAALDATRDRTFAALARTEELLADLPALSAPDLSATLAERAAVAPALEAQHAHARDALAEAEASLALAEEAWERAGEAFRGADGERQAAELKLAHMQEALTAEGVEDLGEVAREHVHANLRDADELLRAREREVREASTELAVFTERVRIADARRTGLRASREAAEAQATPRLERWHSVREATESRALLDEGPSIFEPRWETLHGVELALEARSRCAILLERLRASRGGDECVEVIAQENAKESDPSELEDASKYLAIWRAVRDWLARRLPTHVGDVGSPVEALDRLRVHLSLLEERLARQEKDLRGASEDVARGIDVQVRRAQAQVRRLNVSLEGITFGSIAAIRVKMKRNERMAQILEALREGAAQELLFQTSMPIEEALDEIFRRFGGGRGGGARILDYREYLELAVEVRRGGKSDWELASPTRLSTGEAIGVGAALMMVVLTEWERDAHLLRARRASGSLRFLFLDEANRLSQDNLAVLFDLCQNLDLQLLIAAPEVARSVGNTTYRLVRKVGEDGSEEVLVSGRRTVEAASLPE